MFIVQPKFCLNVISFFNFQPSLPVNADGFVTCPACSDNIVADYYERHKKSCTGRKSEQPKEAI